MFVWLPTKRFWVNLDYVKMVEVAIPDRIGMILKFGPGESLTITDPADVGVVEAALESCEEPR